LENAKSSLNIAIKKKIYILKKKGKKEKEYQKKKIREVAI
jgi:hypothetical protein